MISLQRKADLLTILIIGLGMPTYYKVKYYVDGLLPFDAIFAPTGLLEIVFALILAIITVVLYRRGGQLLHPIVPRWFKVILFILISEAVAIAFTLFFFNFIFPVGVQTSFVFDVALIAALLPLLISGVADRIFLESKVKADAKAKLLAEKEAINARFEALKGRLSPHFLFNSLNTLADIIEEDQKLAVRFVEEMSVIYRYIIEQRDKTTVPLSKELEAVESLLFLMESRRPGALSVEVNIPEETRDYAIVPLALQTLVENALKHNQYSKTSPLRISIAVDAGSLVVENSRAPRADVVSTQSGLDSLKKRYEYLCKKIPTIFEDEHMFRVVLPNLKSLN